MKVGPGFCPVLLRSATSRTRCWLLPKGSKSPPPQGQNSYFLLRSPNLAKPRADQRLDPPALLAVAAAPLAFGMIGDFPLRIAKEIPIPVSIKFSPPVLFFRAVYPLFFGGFSPCVRLFRGGWDTYPTPEEKAAHRGDSGFYCFFTVVGGMCFASVFPATNRRFPRAATTFFRFSSSTAEEAKQYRCYTSVTAL